MIQSRGNMASVLLFSVYWLYWGWCAENLLPLSASMHALPGDRREEEEDHGKVGSGEENQLEQQG